MLKVVIVLMLSFGFVACKDDIAELIKGDPIPVPTGNYTSKCIVDGADSYRDDVEITGQTEIVLTPVDFTASTDCTGTPVTGTPITITITVADFSYADKVSFFQYTDEASMTLKSVAYSVDNGIIYLSIEKENVTEENAASSFSAFIGDPKGEAEDVYTPAVF